MKTLHDEAEEFLQKKDIWNHPIVTDRNNKNGYEVAELMASFAREHAKAKLGEAAERAEKYYTETPRDLFFFDELEESITKTPLEQ